MEPAFDVAVVGGGISGLAAAFRLERGGARTVLLEGSERVGGALRTLHRDGFTFELGPSSVRDTPAVAALWRDAKLLGGRITASPRARRRWIWQGELQEVPSRPLALLRTPLVPWSAKLALLREPFIRRRAGADEETVGELVRRRLGPAWLASAVGPLVAGIHAGDPERLSAAHAPPKLCALERDHGSLVRGALAARRAASPGAWIGHRDGFDALARQLAARGGEVRTNAPVRRLEPHPDGWRLRTPDGVVAARRVVLALPAEVSGELLAPLTDGRSLDLAEVPYAAVAVVCLGFRRQQVSHPLDGFGYLVARGTGQRALGCVFTSSLFSGRAPDGCVAVTALLGGASDAEIVAAPEEEILRTARADLAVALGARGEPVVAHVQRWRRAIPQYERGHGRFLRLRDALEDELPGIVLAGNWSDGVSVADCVQRGARVADRLLGAPSTAEVSPALVGAR